MLVTLASLKGGAGKSTIAVNLAHAIAKSGKRVLLVDADPQGSVSGWAGIREEPPPFVVVGMARDTIHKELPAMMEGFDHAVIDGPPRVSAIARSTILAADLVLIPVQPSSYDVWAASETIVVVKEAQQYKTDLKCALVINRKIAKTGIGQEIGTALKDFDIPLLATSIGQRVIFAESSAGYTVLELEPAGVAAKEILSLSKAVLKTLGVAKW